MDSTAFDYVLTLPALVGQAAGDVTDYLAGKGYGPGKTGQLAVGIGGDGTVLVQCNRDPTADLQAYVGPTLPAPIDLIQTLVAALNGTAVQKQAALAALQAVQAVPPRDRRKVLQGLG